MWFQPPPPTVSYHQQVAPILALHCHSCHGDAGGLSTRSHAELMRGGDMGPVVKPGDPDGSLLVHFIEGRRGDEHRMPLGGRPLTKEQIALIRRWIAEGANEDVDTTKKYVTKLKDVRVGGAAVLRVVCKVNVAGYLTLRVSDAGGHHVLFTEVASIKSPKERGDAGAPGERIWWDIRPARKWPGKVAVELTVQYAPEEPRGTALYVERLPAK
jgi:Planctomycete cytochrome C